MGLLHDKVFSYENGGDCSSATASGDQASIKSKTNNPVLKLKQKYLGPVQRGESVRVAKRQADKA